MDTCARLQIGLQKPITAPFIATSRDEFGNHRSHRCVAGSIIRTSSAQSPSSHYRPIGNRHRREIANRKDMSLPARCFAGIANWFKSIVNALPIATCPKCKKNWVREVVDKRLVDQRQSFRTVTRNDKHYSRQGYEQIGQTERKEQIVVIVSIYRLTCCCKSCGHSWQETAREVSE